MMRVRPYLVAFAFAIAAVVLPLANRAPAAAATETVIANFEPRTQAPSSGLTADPAGNFYGEVTGGSGAVFELQPRPGGEWSYSVVHRFFGGIFGCYPNGGLARDAHGNLYGVGGCGFANGGGTVFELSPPARSGGSWRETILYRFRGVGSGDPEFLHGRPALDARGNLYGTSFAGGRYGAGAIFRLTPPAKRHGLWQETTLYSFTGGADGLYVSHGVILDRTGTLFGTTEYGGVATTFCSSGCGTVFALTPPKHGDVWTETVVRAFVGTDGALPQCDLIEDAAGNVYGTTEVGQAPAPAGTVFELARPAKPAESWTENILYAFANIQPDAGYPLAGVTFGNDGALYGTTSSGGQNGKGSAYRLAPPAQRGKPWTETVLHGFGNRRNDGTYPLTPLAVGLDGALYGTTQYGGAGACVANGKLFGCGTAYRI